MARCQSATVFNSHSQQFQTSFTSGGGQTPYAVTKYKKRSDTSALRIFFTAMTHTNFNAKCMHVFVIINDQPCRDPYSIESSIREWQYAGGNDRAPPENNPFAGKFLWFQLKNLVLASSINS